MSFLLKDRIKESSTASGLGAISLAGSSLGFKTFSSVLSDGDTTYYTIADRGGPEFETGIGQYISSNNSIIRLTVFESSNNNSIVNFGSNTKDVFISLPASVANNAITIGNLSYAAANTALSVGQSAFAAANNEPIAKSAFAQANTAITNAATALSVGQNAFAAANNEPIAKSAFAQANTATINAATALNVGQSAFTQANTATTNAATALSVGQSAFTQANTATTNAATALGVGQSAFSAANTKLSSSGGTLSGSLSISQDLTVSGNVYISGNTTTLSSNNLSINDSLIYLAQDNPANLQDIGIVGHFTSDHYQHTGFVRDATDGVWKLFSNVAAEPETTMDFTGAIYDQLKVGSVIGNLYGNANTVTNGVYTTDTGTVTNAMLAGSITNSKLQNSVITITSGTGLSGGGSVALGSNITLTANTGSISQAGIVQLTDSISSSSITTAATPNNVKTVYDFATVVNSTAGLAFTQANTALSVGQSAFTQANTATTNAATALTVGQSAFAAANNEPIAKSAFAQANTATTNAATALGVGQSAFTQANTALSVGQSAFTQANTATTNAATALGVGQSAFTQANTATTNAATANTNAGLAFTQANTATTNAATANTNAGLAFTQANTATTNAATALSVGQSAFAAANNEPIAKSAFAQANTATTNAATALSVGQSAFTQANTATTNAATALSVGQSAFAQANTATTNAATALSVGQSAFTQANTSTTNAATALSVGQSAFAQANTANTLIQTKVSGFYQNTTPSGANTKDTWIHSDTGVKYENVGNTSSPIWIECGPTSITANSQPGQVYSTQSIVNYTPSTTTGVGISVSAANTKGGSGYSDFLQVTNTSGGATNPNKWFRLNSIGTLEIINSSYVSNILSLDDSGNMSISGNTTISGISPGYAPNRPGFRVYGANTTNISATTTLSLSNWAVDWQQGNYLNHSTGIFTAPVAGLYSVNLTARTQNNNYAGLSSIGIQKNGSAMVCYVEFYNNTTMNHAGSSTIVKLAIGDTLKAIVTAGQITFDLNDNWAVAYIG